MFLNTVSGSIGHRQVVSAYPLVYCVPSFVKRSYTTPKLKSYAITNHEVSIYLLEVLSLLSKDITVFSFTVQVLLKVLHIPSEWQMIFRALARALTGGGGYFHIFVLYPTNFF